MNNLHATALVALLAAFFFSCAPTPAPRLGIVSQGLSCGTGGAGGTGGEAATATSADASTASSTASSSSTGAGPTCSDGVKNAAETDVDCGGPTCPVCPAGQGCAASSDCAAGLYCETSPGWAVSGTPALDHTCQPVATAAIATVSSCSLPAIASVAPTVVTYTSDGLTCSVYQPAAGTGLPVVLALPYGGFVAQYAGNADFVNFGKALVTRGFVAVLCDYTKATAAVSGTPHEVSDARCAIRTWGTAAGGSLVGAGYRGSAARLGVLGSSAGGSIALVAVEQADRVDGALDVGTCLTSPLADERGLVKRLVAAAAPADLPGPFGYGAAAFPTNATRLGWYAGYASDPQRAAALTSVSPALGDMAHPYAGAPPVLLLQLSGDATVDPGQSAEEDTALAAHGYRHTRILGAGSFTCGPSNCSHPYPLTGGGAVALPGICTMWSFLAGL